LVTAEEDVQTLTHLGLTISQAKVYLALLELKKATGKIISKHSKVARQEVYRVLAELQKKGLVEKIIAMPTEFKPIPIEDYIPLLIERKKNEISKTRKEATRLIQTLKQKNSKSTFQEEDETHFRLFSEQVAVRREKGTLKAVQTSFDVITSWRDPHSVIFIDIEEIAEALQRSVKIRIIIDKTDEKEVLSDIIRQLKKYPNFKIRYLPNAPKALISIYDEKEAWVCTCTHPELKECPTLRTNNPCLLLILQEYFETMWLTAIKGNFKIPRKPKIA